MSEWVRKLIRKCVPLSLFRIYSVEKGVGGNGKRTIHKKTMGGKFQAVIPSLMVNMDDAGYAALEYCPVSQSSWMPCGQCWCIEAQSFAFRLKCKIGGFGFCMEEMCSMGFTYNYIAQG